jgi:hypothetical protein
MIADIKQLIPALGKILSVETIVRLDQAWTRLW